MGKVRITVMGKAGPFGQRRISSGEFLLEAMDIASEKYW